MWDKIGLSQPDKTTLRLGQLWKDQLINLLSMIFGDELVPCLIVHNGVHVLFDEVLLEMNSYLHLFWVY